MEPAVTPIRSLPLLCLVLASPLSAQPAPAAAPERDRAMLVLDASGSMWGQIGGRHKIELAREAVDTMLDGWTGGDLGLMAYGHRRRGDCGDIEVLRRVDAFDAGAIRTPVAALNPKGMTPITAAVRQAAEELRFGERKATVILVSDGEETCDADPCALGRELEAAGVDFTAHVVGFDIAPGSVAERQLQCLASSTGGRYLPASDARELAGALDEVAAAGPAPAPTPGIAAKPGQSWIEGAALEPETGITLNADADGRAENVDFTVEQTAADCQALCLANDKCAGWHYEPTGSYFVSYPRCHMKGFGFAVRLRQEGEGWVAGIRDGVSLIVDEAASEED